MAYHKHNHNAKVRNAIEVYNQIKGRDPERPDTKIVTTDFPKHGIFIGYRTWMGYKGKSPSQYN